MIGEATTLESSPAGIDGDGFDVLRVTIFRLVLAKQVVLIQMKR